MNPFDAYSCFTMCSTCREDEEILRVLEVEIKGMNYVGFTAALCPECFELFMQNYFDRIEKITNLVRTNVTKVKKPQRKERNGKPSGTPISVK